MNSPTHTIDPDGEVIIILLDANSPFAQLEKNTFTSLDSDNSSPLCDNAQDPPQVTEVSEYPLDEPEPTAKQKKMMRKMKKMKKQPGTIQAALELTSSSQEIAANDAPVEAPAVEDPPAEEPAAGEATTEEPTTTEDPAASEDPAAKDPAVEEIASEESFTEVPVQSCFRIQVSAKHLIFASPVFKKILTGGFKESITYLQKGSVEITAETWDIDALIIVLQAIHGQHYLTPQELTLEMLAKVAVIADYYECKNALYLLADMWIKKMEQDIPTPTITPRDLILWLWIAWFFRLHYIFKLSTSIAISQSDGWIDSLGLPIPGNVIGECGRILQSAWRLMKLQAQSTSVERSLSTTLLFFFMKHVMPF